MPGRKAATADDVDHVSDAAEALSTAALTLRAMAATFDHDGNPRAEAAEIAAGVRVGITHLKIAADALFSNSPGDWVYKDANRILVDLWDAADIVLTVGAALGAGQFPSGANMTVCPIRGALMVAIGRLELLASRATKLHERCRLSLEKDVIRYNRKILRAEARASRPFSSEVANR